jgi:hypothetical protein
LEETADGKDASAGEDDGATAEEVAEDAAEEGGDYVAVWASVRSAPLERVWTE